MSHSVFSDGFQVNYANLTGLGNESVGKVHAIQVKGREFKSQNLLKSQTQ